MGVQCLTIEAPVDGVVHSQRMTEIVLRNIATPIVSTKIDRAPSADEGRRAKHSAAYTPAAPAPFRNMHRRSAAIVGL